MTDNTKKAMFSSNTDRWSTPQDLFDKLDAEFHFNLDPCADESNHKCDKWYSPKQNGLKKSWGGGTERFAILRMAECLANGLRKHIWKALNQTRLWLCLFLPGRILNGFMILSIINRKYASLKGE